MRKPVVTDNSAKPIAPYSQGIIDGDYVFVSGQVPTNPKTGHIETNDVKAATRQTLENVKAIVEAAGSSMDKVVKCNVYLRDINDFPMMNEVYATFFSSPAPARTTIQAGALPGGVPVEIECIARK